VGEGGGGGGVGGGGGGGRGGVGGGRRGGGGGGGGGGEGGGGEGGELSRREGGEGSSSLPCLPREDSGESLIAREPIKKEGETVFIILAPSTGKALAVGFGD